MADSTSSATMKTTLVRKFVMGVTGLGLVVFVIVHMLGNLLFMVGPAAYNGYSHKLLSLGPLLWVIRAGLLLFALFHVWNGIVITVNNWRSRGEKYRARGNAGGVSKKGLSSQSMIYTGIILLVFIVIHINTFALGPYYTTVVNGVEMRDLHTLVAEVFASPLYSFGYAIIMVLLAFHLRHGIWSAFQSLGAAFPRYSPAIYSTGAVLAVLLAIGFILVPLFAYFFPHIALITAN